MASILNTKLRVLSIQELSGNSPMVQLILGEKVEQQPIMIQTPATDDPLSNQVLKLIGTVFSNFQILRKEEYIERIRILFTEDEWNSLERRPNVMDEVTIEISPTFEIKIVYQD